MGDERSDNNLRGRDLVGLGGLLVAAVVGGMVIGLVVDDLAGSSPVGVLVGIAVGVAVGIVGFWLRVRNALRD
jgi:F0F1-type ATP synthase assembly protein I